jgi:hypothetical protein
VAQAEAALLAAEAFQAAEPGEVLPLAAGDLHGAEALVQASINLQTAGDLLQGAVDPLAHAAEDIQAAVTLLQTAGRPLPDEVLSLAGGFSLIPVWSVLWFMDGHPDEENLPEVEEQLNDLGAVLENIGESIQSGGQQLQTAGDSLRAAGYHHHQAAGDRLRAAGSRMEEAGAGLEAAGLRTWAAGRLLLAAGDPLRPAVSVLQQLARSVIPPLEQMLLQLNKAVMARRWRACDYIR